MMMMTIVRANSGEEVDLCGGTDLVEGLRLAFLRVAGLPQQLLDDQQTSGLINADSDGVICIIYIEFCQSLHNDIFCSGVCQNGSPSNQETASRGP